MCLHSSGYGAGDDVMYCQHRIGILVPLLVVYRRISIPYITLLTIYRSLNRGALGPGRRVTGLNSTRNPLGKVCEIHHRMMNFAQKPECFDERIAGTWQGARSGGGGRDRRPREGAQGRGLEETAHWKRVVRGRKPGRGGAVVFAVRLAGWGSGSVESCPPSLFFAPFVFVDVEGVPGVFYPEIADACAFVEFDEA